MAGQDEPTFPITVVFHKLGERTESHSREEIMTQLEYFDSEDPYESATATDAKGRRVVLKVEGLEILEFRLAE